MRPTWFVLSLLAAASLGCGDPRVAVEVRYNGSHLYRCDDALMSELTPKPGGWAFKCSDGSSIYFTYETDDTSAKGTIERIAITPIDGSGPQGRDLVLFSEEEAIDCPTAGAERGGEPFPTGWRGVEPGIYAFDVLDPCGKLEVAIKR